MPSLRSIGYGLAAIAFLGLLLVSSCNDRRADRARAEAEELAADTTRMGSALRHTLSERDALRLGLARQRSAMDSLRRLGNDQAERLTEAGNTSRRIERDTRADVEAVLVQPAPPDDSVGTYLLEEAARLGSDW